MTSIDFKLTSFRGLMMSAELSDFPPEVAPRGLFEDGIGVGKHLGLGSNGHVSMLVRVSEVGGSYISGYSVSAKARFWLCQRTHVLTVYCTDAEVLRIRDVGVLYSGPIPPDVLSEGTDAVVSYMRHKVSFQRVAEARPGVLSRIYSWFMGL